jgi:ATP-dependent DNA ligase
MSSTPRRENEPVQLPVMPPVSPMLAKPVRSIPPGASYEPKWDGFRSICFRDFEQVELGSRNERPMTRYFPELIAAAAAELPERCVIDGEIVIATDHGLTSRRCNNASTADSRVRMLAKQTPASFIAFDLLALGDDDYTKRPFNERRAALVDALTDAGPWFHVTPATTELTTAQLWFDEFEGAGLAGLIAKPLTITYQPDKRVMFKIKHERTADCVVAGYRLHKSGDDAIGSLLLGLYKDDSTLASVGVIGAFPMAKRRQLLIELQPLVTTFDDHPWNWAAHMAGDRTPRRNEGSRWNAGRTSRSYRCDLNAWSRSVTTIWKANGSATQRNSTAGAPTAIHAHAPTPNSNTHSPSASATSFQAWGQTIADEPTHLVREWFCRSASVCASRRDSPN